MKQPSITASDLVVRRLHQHDIKHAFGVVGGAIMYITDALRRCDGIHSTFTHHEQAAAIAAEAYSKLTHRPALLFATAGPGTTNVITGVADAYMDSIPMVILIGDVRSTIAADFSRQRYNAPQEVDQASLMRPIVKQYLYLRPSMKARDIVGAVDLAVQNCLDGRPGPVCLSIPLDVQGMPCDAAALDHPILQKSVAVHSSTLALRNAFQATLSSNRPLVLLGAGVRISGIADQVEKLLAKYSLPWCVTIGAVDLQDHANVLSVGCVGPTSQRAANTLLQAADCVLALATSFDQSVTGFNVAELIQNKTVYLVNVDPGENLRFGDEHIVTIEAGLSDFLASVSDQLFSTIDHDSWRDKIDQVKALLNPDIESSMRTSIGPDYLSAYDITAEISRQLPVDSTVVLGISLDAHSVFNAFQVKRGQRIIVSRNLGPMGWDVPALLGAAFGVDTPRALVLITGDGSLMLNVQELAVLAGLQVPACIFVFNNDGYVSIRTTQTNFFGTDFFGCSAKSGLNIPALEPLARGFGLEYDRLENLTDIGSVLTATFSTGKPRLVECRIDPAQVREPRLVSRVIDGVFKTPAVHDMTPVLSAEVAASVARLLD